MGIRLVGPDGTNRPLRVVGCTGGAGSNASAGRKRCHGASSGRAAGLLDDDAPIDSHSPLNPNFDGSKLSRSSSSSTLMTLAAPGRFASFGRGFFAGAASQPASFRFSPPKDEGKEGEAKGNVAGEGRAAAGPFAPSARCCATGTFGFTGANGCFSRGFAFGFGFEKSSPSPLLSLPAGLPGLNEK
eukprot:gene14689-biopygen14516